MMSRSSSRKRCRSGPQGQRARRARRVHGQRGLGHAPVALSLYERHRFREAEQLIIFRKELEPAP